MELVSYERNKDGEGNKTEIESLICTLPSHLRYLGKNNPINPAPVT
jgi:hypothetical protein